jgi:hypothetical protein
MFTSTSRPRITPRIVVFLAVIAVLVGYPVYVYVDSVVSGGIKSHGEYKEVDLKAMSLFPFDQTAGRVEDIPQKWRELDGQKIVVEGEMWDPLSAGNQVVAFQLVYSIAKCCFNGPPQIQHFVQARTLQGKNVGYYTGPVRVKGTLHVRVVRDDARITGVYHLDVESVEPVT